MGIVWLPLLLGLVDSDQLGDKTLVVWATPAPLDQRGGSALTLDDLAGKFDGLIFGEIAPRRWMAGSEMHRRSHRDQGSWVEESTAEGKMVAVALAYEGRRVTIYRDGQPYAQYESTTDPVEFGPRPAVLIGRRHVDQADEAAFRGAIADARIYDRALTAEEIAALRPDDPAGPAPWAWWPFQEGPAEAKGRFPAVTLLGNAKVEGGQLKLDGTGSLLAARGADDLNRASAALQPAPTADIEAARRLRHLLLADRHRPTYHFVIPEDFAMPFDPNGAIFWKGRHHMFYIYQERGTHFFGHVSSHDALHWRHHPPALFPTPDSPEKGIFSGNCFVDAKGRAIMIYHGVDAGNCLAVSTDDNLETWKKLPGNPIIPNAPADAPYASWDPHGWREGDSYYAIFGGKQAAIFKSADLTGWRHVGDLLHHTVPGVDLREDISCPDLFKLGNKHVLVCISHRLGTRYYTGEWKNEQFHPDLHEPMSWVDNGYFAPETYEDDKGRRILWAWTFDRRPQGMQKASGYSGEMALPRELTLGDDGRLRQRPLAELQRLRMNEWSRESIELPAGQEVMLEGVAGDALELEVEFEVKGASRVGAVVNRSPDGAEQTRTFVDVPAKTLTVDATKSSLAPAVGTSETGPFAVGQSGTVTLRVFVDRSFVEAFADDRQAVMRRTYPSRADSLGVALFAEGGAAVVRRVRTWPLAPTNPY